MSKHRYAWAAGLIVLLWVTTFVVASAFSRMVRGTLDGELLAVGLVILAGAISIVIAAWVFERHLRPRPVYGKDGRLDLRCVQCGYAMNGLSEARCPECGQRYTIDELLVAQGFEGIRATDRHDQAAQTTRS